jgi:DNA polymerase theta
MIYGIGEKALSENLAVTEDEAKQFMESFIDKYEGVKQFIFNTIEECREKEYVETINGRRRYLPHINSSNSMIRLKAERQAVNSTIQGSAADLIKTAMIAVDKALIDNEKIDSRIVLEMHDELMYEVKCDDCHQFVILLRECMQNCSKSFTVDLPVKSKVGRSWGELQEYNQF